MESGVLCQLKLYLFTLMQKPCKSQSDFVLYKGKIVLEKGQKDISNLEQFSV